MSYTSLAALVRLRYNARGFQLPARATCPAPCSVAGNALDCVAADWTSMSYATIAPGDDIRNMDWRVTNRTGKPHVRVYTEERDRPVIVMVDQRLPMFFGSVNKMKSVVAAELAALTAWRVLSVGDRVGAILFNDSRELEIRPRRSERQLLAWLGDLTSMNHDLSVAPGHTSNPEALASALKLLERRAGHDYLVVIISDFYGWNDEALKTIKRVNQHNDIICSLVYDPLESDISSAQSLVVSDGHYQIEIDPSRHDLGEKFEASFQSSIGRVQDELNRHQIPVLPVDTITPVSEQLREKTGWPETAAMSAPPLPEVFGNYALGDFAEVVPPESISWLPQTTGWLWLGIAVLLLAGYRGFKRWRAWYGNRYRREGLARLPQSITTSDTSIAELNQTLKLVALVAYSRTAVAQLSGPAWAEFLNRQCESPAFDEQQLQLLATGGYQEVKLDPTAYTDLLNACRRWIREHRSPGNV